MEPSNATRPSNLYYNHQNNKQIYASPSRLQTKLGIILLTNTQDIRYMDAVLVNIKTKKQENIALLILKSGQLTGKGTGVKILNRQVTKEMEEEFEESSGDERDFLELNDATKKATKEVQLNNKYSKVLEIDEHEY